MTKRSALREQGFMDPSTGEIVEGYPFDVFKGRNTARFALMFDPENVEADRSRTSQEFADETDVNQIMKRYLATGTIPVYVDRMAINGDVSEFPSFQEMQNVLVDAQNAFMALPSALRERFGNDPAKFVEFANDKANVDELEKLGLLSPEAVERLDTARRAKAAQAADKPPGGPPGPAVPPSDAED